MYRYIGPFPSDFVPILPNDTFAIMNMQANDTPGGHWIMTAMFHHVTNLASSLGLTIKNYPFLKHKCRQLIPTRLQTHPSVCGFYTDNAVIHLFKFQQEELTGVNNVNVLSFISNYM